MKLLHIDSSISMDSVSRVVSAAIAERIASKVAHVDITYRDLGANPLPHLDQSDRPPHAHPNRLAVNAAVLQEFLDADHVVVGAPMYNFNIASQLKAWIDRLAVAGKTFRYTENGPVGLAEGKKVYIASSRGNFYGMGTPNVVYDHQESYLTVVFQFFGVTELRFVRAEGATSNPKNRARAIEHALAEARLL